MIDMYIKCGFLEFGRKVFYEMPKRDVISWTELISVYAKNGNMESAGELFDGLPTLTKQTNKKSKFGYIYLLDMNFNTLSGAIPAELGWIKKLTVLALSMNRFTGAIPVFLFILTEPRRLELAFNNFTCKIPKEFGALTKLEILYFAQ
ncbi:hypothetical protein DKX38_000234 [Salix brachista]|uniref:Uncharacterized protein n=1 Tax=Salix brachista TaxID=2182728 RepID=A0A5N5P018_9ROSI|nr:hypothetical protein DKX38_000234 [Salix brachista]